MQPEGPTVPIPQSPVEVFNLFFTDEICRLIVEQTNLYAQQNLGEDEWDKVTVEELRAYFGFKVIMGLVPLPAVDDYWRRDPFSTMRLLPTGSPESGSRLASTKGVSLIQQ